MTPIAIATEDQLSEAIVVRLVSEIASPYVVHHKLGGRGNGYLRSRMNSWCEMAQQQVMFVLTDLDRANCLVEFRNQWLKGLSSKNLIFRIAVREVESWILADHAAMRSMFGEKAVLPRVPDELDDPKQSLLMIAKSAPRDIRADLLRIVDGSLRQGLGYNTRLTALINSEWCPERAAKRSPSLARARLKLEEVVTAFRV